MHKHASANRFYRLVWSTVHRCWVAVAEGTRSHGKGAARRRAAAVVAGSLAAAAAAAGPLPPNALPSGMQLVAGQAGVNVQGNNMTVSQATPQAILNWQAFNIGANGQVRFDQPNASAVALNRVVGGQASEIFGKLSSNGKVFLVNPQGVLFGAGAQVDVGGLVASSLGITDQDFLSGSYRFSGNGSGAVRNEGSIKARGGVVALLAPAVSNSGSITAAGGSVALAAGNAVGLDFRGDGLIMVRVEQGALDALAENKGLLQADGGQVLLTAKAADALARSTVNNAGVVQARGLVAEGGTIRLVGDGQVRAGQLDASSANGRGGSVSVDGGFVSLDGTVRADGKQGGSIAVKAGGDLSAASELSAKASASRGGSISLAAGASVVENSSASVSVAGATDGGTIALEAGGSLLASGRHDARGVGGLGGRVDISGADVRLLGATVDASGATQGGLVRVGGAFQGGATRADAPDVDRFTGRWGETARIANSNATFINDSTVLDVSARGAGGQGGTAIVWSDKQTTMLGAVKAAGAARGGAVEVSAHKELRYVGLERLEIGAGGRLLLDPKDIVIGERSNQWTYDAIIGKGFSGARNVDVASLKDGEGFGYSVALTSDGKGLAVGAPYNEGVGAAADTNYGAVRLFTFADGQFNGGTLVGTIGRGFTGGNNLDLSAQLSGQDMFGSSVALSKTGDVMAVGALANFTGKVYTFGFGAGFTAPVLNQTITSNSGAGNGFGVSVALNGAGDKLAVGALLTNSVELLSKSGGTFGYTASVTGGTAPEAQYGTAVALNDAGTQLAVGAPGEDSGRGAVYLYANPFAGIGYVGKIGQGAGWKDISLNEGELFGSSLAMNDAGTRLAVGAPGNGGLGSTGPGPGAVRVFDYTGNYNGMNLSAVIGRDYTQGANASLDIDDYGNFGFALAMNGAGDSLVVAQPFDNSFDGSTVASGTVSTYRLLPAPNASSLLFDQSYPKANVNASVDAQKLAEALANGTSITLQANNDITWEAGNNISAAGNGQLSLQAGRSVALNSNITMGGDLNVVANAGTSAGVVDAYRASGSATIAVASGTAINAGNVSFSIDTGAGQTNKASGDITIAGTVNAGTIKVINKGPTAGSDVVIGASGRLVGSAGGDSPTVIVAAAGAGGGTFTNNAGTLALQGGPSGYYNVFSDSPQNTLEGLTGYSKHYDQSYDPAATFKGNRFFYKLAPTLNVSVQSASKTYDGTGALPSLSYSATGYIDGDSGSLTGSAEATGFTKNVGFYSWGQGTLASSLGYKINLVAGSGLQVNRRALTVTATGNNKVYDGTLAATVNVGDNRVNGDTLTIARSAAFGDKNAGNGKTVSVTGISISGADANNYLLTSTTAATTAHITQRTLNVGATAANKAYDGSAAASATITDNHVAGDSVVVNVGSAAFADKNAGLGKTVDVTGLSLSGTDAGNYVLASAATSTVADIAQRQLTVGLNAVDKVYDGSVAATVSYTDNRVIGDVFGVAGSASFADKNAGNGKTVTANGLALSGADAGNYALASTTATGTASITPRSLAVAATGNSKVYDGTAAATVNFSDNRVAGDVLGVSGSASFGDKNVGTGKAISVTGIALSGADSGNYALSATTAAASGDIAQRTLNLTLGAGNKTYDGTTAATVSFGDDRVAGDVLTVSGSASFDTKNAGNGKTVNVSGLALSGTDSGNYALSGTTASTTANILQRALNLSAVAANKVYDGSAAASVTLGDDRVAGDVLSLGGSASFNDKNAGNGKTVNVSGLALSGTDSGNYVLSSTTAQASADITQRQLTVGLNASGKTYDGTAAAAVSYSDNRVSGDVLGVSGSAAFADKNAGTGKTVTATGLSLSGTDAGNYALASTTATSTASIAQRMLVVTAGGNNKVYDGTAATTVNLNDDRVAGDVLDVSGSASFADKNAGTGKTVSVGGIAISGSDAGNYALASTTASTSADIVARSLTVTASGIDRVYDGSDAASVSFGDNRVSGDVLTVSGNAAFADKQAGNAKTVSVSGIALSGADAGNYTLSSTSAGTTATISQRALSVTAAAANKVYDQSAAASVTLGDDRVSGDVLVLGIGSAAFNDKNVGVGKAVSIDGISLSGADSANYVLASTHAGASADITPRALAVAATGANKVYDGTTAVSVSYTDNRIAGDSLTVNGAAAFADKSAGASKAINVSGLALSGADAGNYVLSSTTASAQADIGRRSLTVSAQGNSKVYDGNAVAALSLSDNRVAGDALVLSANGSFSDKNVGSGKAVTASGITVTGSDAGNYQLASTTAHGTGAITPRALSATVAAADKVYDGTATASVVLAGDDRVAGDQLVLASGMGTFADKNAGAGKAVALTGVSLGGADAGNYTVTFVAQPTANIAQRALHVNVSGIDKVYDGSRDGKVAYGDDRVAGDSLQVAGNAAFNDKNVGTDKKVSVSGLALSGADAANYVISDANVSTSASITPKALVVKADDHVRAYGGSNPALTWTAKGLVGGDTESLLDGVQASTSATRESGAGNYAISIKGNALANYTVKYVDGVLVVQRAPQEAENAIGSAVNPVMPGQAMAAGQGGNWGAQLANDGGTLVPMPAAVAKETSLVNPAPAEAAVQLASVPASPAAQQIAAPVQGVVNAVLAQPQAQPGAGEQREYAIGGGSRVMVLDGGVNTGGAPN